MVCIAHYMEGREKEFTFTQTELTKESSISVGVEDGGTSLIFFSGPGTYVFEVFGKVKSMPETSL